MWLNELNKKSSKSNVIILPKIFNVTDYVPDYNFCYVL